MPTSARKGTADTHALRWEQQDKIKCRFGNVQGRRAKLAQVRAESRLTVTGGITVSEEGKVLEQGREGGVTVTVRGVWNSCSEKESAMVSD